MSDNAMTSQKAAGERQPATSRETVAVRPAVDVYEDAQGIRLTADLPGVGNEQLKLEVDADTLIIEGEAEFELPEGVHALHAEMRSNRFQRSFTLSRELDVDAIKADMKNGVLTVFLPKRKEHQPRKIAVNLG